MSPESERLAGALFHSLRATQRKRVAATHNPIYRAFVKRARYDEAERRFYEKLARWEWEREVER